MTSTVPKLTITYWRDIPAQVTAKAGRKQARRELSPNFQLSIDQAAMKAGAHGTDEYLEGWRRGASVDCDENLDAVVEEAAVLIELEFDDKSLKELIASGGYKPTTK